MINRITALLLFFGLAWGQVEQDKLVLKDGTRYLGEFSTIDGENVLFKPEGAFGFQPIPFNTVYKLELANGLKLVTNGKIEQDRLVFKDGTRYLGEFSTIDGENVLFKPEGAFGFQPIPFYTIYKLELANGLKLKDGQILFDGSNVKNTLALEEYQKLSTKEKAIYDANLFNVQKWALYGPTSIIVFMGSIFLHKVLIGGEFWESPIFLGGSPAASLIIPYFVLNSKEKFNFPKSILTDSEKEIYEQAYSKKLKQRKIKYAVGSTILTGAVFVGVVLYSLGQAMSDFDMGPQPPGPW